MNLLTWLYEHLIQFGQNPLAVGLLTIFGVFAAIEFTLKYLFRSARFLKFLTQLGLKRAAQMYKRKLQSNLRDIRELRKDGGLENLESNARSHQMVGLNLVLTGIFIFLLMTALGWKHNYAMLEGWLGATIRFTFTALISFPVLYYAKVVSRDPQRWRRHWVAALRETRK